MTGFAAKRYAYDELGNLIYEGEALPGSSEEDAMWIIAKYEWADGRMTAVRWADGIATNHCRWDLREFYEYI